MRSERALRAFKHRKNAVSDQRERPVAGFDGAWPSMKLRHKNLRNLWKRCFGGDGTPIAPHSDVIGWSLEADR
jgi:hypothetical protein